MNPYKVPPSYHCWAPWIGGKTRKSDVVLNTEYQKNHTSKAPAELKELTVTEDHLLNELLNQKVFAVCGFKINCFLK